MPFATYAEPQTLQQAMDQHRLGRIVDLERMPGFGSEGVHGWVIKIGQVACGFLSYDGATWWAEGVLTEAEARGANRDSAVQTYLRRLRQELRL